MKMQQYRQKKKRCRNKIESNHSTTVRTLTSKLSNCMVLALFHSKYFTNLVIHFSIRNMILKCRMFCINTFVCTTIYILNLLIIKHSYMRTYTRCHKSTT